MRVESMGRIFLLGKICLLFIFIAALFLLVARAEMIRTMITQQFGLSRTAVAGAKTSMESEVKEDIKDYADGAVKQIMKLRIEDVVHSVSRVKKIGSDLNGLKDEIISWGSKIR